VNRVVRIETNKLVLFAKQTAPHSSSGVTPFHFVHERDPIYILKHVNVLYKVNPFKFYVKQLLYTFIMFPMETRQRSNIGITVIW